MSPVSVLGLPGELLSSPYTQYVIPITIAAVCWVNMKVIPGFWHIRLFKGIITQSLRQRKIDTSKSRVMSISEDSPYIFSYLVTTHHNPPLECDYNMHKSNSTFFSDLDINRAQLLGRLFGGFPRKPSESGKGTEKTLNVALGGVSCVFKREIKPFQRYEIWSRVLAWDHKWLYMVSYFVVAGTGEKVIRSLHTESGKPSGVDFSKAVLASSLSRYVFKDGRMTISPADVLGYNGLISEPEGAENESVFTQQQQKGLEVARLFHGLDTLPTQFEPVPSSVLGIYADL
ncbi:hypothetical protein FE257_005853 [Aspergillus nanangensis]|uniref:Capsule polysaccharide biosynthesis protein n=1 Tax=Aspergillus nanangensis TaxID=2582783 RepID=A0AAD4CRG8_ASPNN|nr:hypothetical protein FE257_005853 [Aspergillus nanangensis]